MFILISLSFSLLALVLIATPLQKYRVMFAWLFFFIGPLLTYFDLIGVLTGFNSSDFNQYLFGITFYTLYISYQISKQKEISEINPIKFIFSVINPLYYFTGPIPIYSLINNNRFRLKRIIKIFNIVHSDLILGIFFACILAPSISYYLFLKSSQNIIDIVLFGLFFEFFVYFNFAGYSMIAWALMRIIGVRAPRNFKQPFGSTSIIEYWQRWHISLSLILKELFYKNLRPIFGLYISVFFVFMASAMWHGISLNFILWGFFHSTFWCITNYLNKFNLKIINYFLMVICIIIGRVIFSELDWIILSSKMSVIIEFSKWNSNSNFLILDLTRRDNINLLFIIIIISWEILSPRLGFLRTNYNHFRTPFVSSIILLYTVFAFTGLNLEPIYGNR